MRALELDDVAIEGSPHAATRTSTSSARGTKPHPGPRHWDDARNVREAPRHPDAISVSIVRSLDTSSSPMKTTDEREVSVHA